MVERDQWQTYRETFANQGHSPEETDRLVEQVKADHEKQDAFYATAPPVEVVCRIYRRWSPLNGRPRFVIKAHPSYGLEFFTWPEVIAHPDTKERVVAESFSIEYDESMPPQPKDDPGVYRG